MKNFILSFLFLFSISSFSQEGRKNSLFIKYGSFLLKIFFVLIFVIGCKTNNAKKDVTWNPTKKDTVYILFDDSFSEVSKSKSFQYKNHNPKYYWISYNLSTYWEQERDTLENGLLNDGYRFIGNYNHSFWYGTYKVRPEYPEFDDSQIYGNSQVLKKHKSFLTKHKNKIIAYSWFKNRTPPNVWEIFKPYKLNKNKPTLFLIDKNEYTKDSIVLRNVVYHQEIIQ